MDNYGGIALLTNATLSGNSAYAGGGIYEYAANPNGTIIVKNSIVAFGSSGANCFDDTAGIGTIKSNGHNLSNDETCAPDFTQPGDVNGVNPNLGPLTNNGGTTLTQITNPPSPAIDAIPNGTNGCGTTLTTDQRGAARPINGKCDIGAVEYGWLHAHLWLAFVRR